MKYCVKLTNLSAMPRVPSTFQNIALVNIRPLFISNLAADQITAY